LNDELQKLQDYQAMITRVLSQREEIQKCIANSTFKIEELEKQGATAEQLFGAREQLRGV
jgi:hypothetical protein